jgi:hypothetical protein
MIHKLSQIEISPQMYLHAKAIQGQNHKENHPSRFKKTDLNKVTEIWHQDFKREMAFFLCADHVDSIDSVMISCPEGVEAHVDLLDENDYEKTTILTPVILPDEPTQFTVFHEENENSGLKFRGEYSVALQVGIPCVFNHSYRHSLTLEKTPANCVLIMSALRK